MCWHTEGCPQRAELQWAENWEQGGSGTSHYMMPFAFLCQKHHTTSCPLTGCPDQRLNFIDIRNKLLDSTEPSWLHIPSPLGAYPHLQVACWWSVVDLDVAVVGAGKQLSIPEPGDDSTGVSKYLASDIHLIPFPGVDSHRALKLWGIWKKHIHEGNMSQKNSGSSPVKLTVNIPCLGPSQMWERETNVGRGQPPHPTVGRGAGLLLKDIRKKSTQSQRLFLTQCGRINGEHAMHPRKCNTDISHEWGCGRFTAHSLPGVQPAFQPELTSATICVWAHCKMWLQQEHYFRLSCFSCPLPR